MRWRALSGRPSGFPAPAVYFPQALRSHLSFALASERQLAAKAGIAELPPLGRAGMRGGMAQRQREGVPPAKPPRYWRQLRDAYSDPGLQLLNLALPVILTCMISPPLNAPGTLEVQEGAALPTMQFIPTGAPGPAELAGLNFKTLKLYEVPAGGEPVRTTVNVAMEQAWGIS